MNYPYELRIHQSIDNVVDNERMQLLDGTDAIEVIIRINNSHYPKEKVKEAINEICQKVAECYY